MTSLEKLLILQFVLALIYFIGDSTSVVLIVTSFNNDFFVKKNVLILPFGLMLIIENISLVLSVIHVSGVYSKGCTPRKFHSIQKPNKVSDSVQIMFLMCCFVLFIMNLIMSMMSDDITPPSPFGRDLMWVFSGFCIYQFLTFIVALKIFFEIRKTLVSNNQENISLVD